MVAELQGERNSNEVEKMDELNLPVRKLAAVFMMILGESRRETSRIINTSVRFLMAYAIRRWTRHINWKLGGVQQKEGRKEVIQRRRTWVEETRKMRPHCR
jgi:hypothetical protein